MRIAKEGYPLILTGAGLTAVAAVAGWKLASGALGLATLAIAGFFRDPEREDSRSVKAWWFRPPMAKW